MAALAIVAGQFQLLVEPASANTAVTLSASSASVAPGSTVDLTAAMPVAGVGTVTQEIVQTIDPTTMKLTGVADITYPTGWTLSYSTDGTSFSATTPASSASWAAVRAVKATGNVNSQGSENGFQIATGTASGGAVSLSPGNITASGSGDGFQVFFDPARTRVFNVFHHMLNGAALDCHVIATGATCAGFPFNPGIAATGQYSTGRVVGTKIWIPIYTSAATAAQSTASFRCVDISAVLSSGGSPALCATSNVVMATGDLSADRKYTNVAFTAFQMIDGVPLSGSSAESKIWGVIARTGNLVCLDTALSAPCSGMPANGWATQVKGTRFNTKNDGVQTSIVKWGNNIYIKGSTSNTADGDLVIGCVLASDPTQDCTGFTSTGKNLGANSTAQKVGRLVLLPNALGEVQGACLLGDTRNLTVIAPVRVATSAVAIPCWDSSGTAFLGPASLSNLVTATFNTGFSEYQFPVQKGSRIYWGNGINFAGSVDYPPRALCWDAALNSGAGGLCTGLPAGSATVPPGYITDNYTVTPDPELADCMWVTRHEQPNIISVDIFSNARGCSRDAPVRASFSGNTVVPRMACSATSTAIREWKSFTLTSPAPSANFTAVLSVRSTNGAVIDGWQRVPITAGTAVNLSTLDPTVTGATPSFLVDFTVSSGSVSTATAAVQAVGDAPQLCLKLTALPVCPSAVGPIDPAALLPGQTVVAGSGSSTVGGVTTAFASASTSVSVGAASPSQCGSTLTGTATESGTSNKVAGATVTLLDSSGNPILDANNQPITRTTAADGTYSFGYLFPGAYKVRFGSIVGGAISTATVTGGGSGTTNAQVATCTQGTTSTLDDPTGDGLLQQVVSSEVISRDASVNLVTNGDFTATTDQGSNSTVLIGQFVTGRHTMPGWTVTGGGVNTYARRWASGSTAPNGASGHYVYFGNDQGVIVKDGATVIDRNNFSTLWNANGTRTTPLSLNITASGYGELTDAPVALTQSIPTVAGATYRLQFWQRSEPYTTQDGIAALDVGTYSRVYFRVYSVSANWRYYTFDFVATASTTSFSIMSWGHWGPSSNADELAIDDIKTVRCVPADTAVTSNASTLTVGTNGVVNASYVSDPRAVADTSTGKQGTAQSITPLTNDTASSGASYSGGSTALRFCGVGESYPNCTATTTSVSGQGSYSISGTTVTFTPCSANNTPAGIGCTGPFTGVGTAVTYQSTDSLGRQATSTITPTVVAVPVLTADVSSGAFNAVQTITPLANDAAGVGTTLSASSVKLCTTATANASCTGSTLAIAGQGSYSVDASGVVTFTPCSANNVPAGASCTGPFIGVATPIKYVVSDALGQQSNSTIAVTVNAPPAPSAAADVTSGVVGVAQSVTPFANDTVGAAGVSFTASSVKLCGAGQTPPNCSLTGLNLNNQGMYSVNMSTGLVTFTPCSANNVPAGIGCAAAFTGSATPATYQVSTNTGQVASSTYTPTFVGPPTATADTSSGAWNTPQTISVLGNDSGAGSALLASSVKLCGVSPVETAPNCTQSSVTVANQGSYAVNPDGTVTFTPLSSFTGAATAVRYVVADGIGQKANATITPTVVAPPLPVAADQTKMVLPGESVVFTALDRPGGLTTIGGPSLVTASTCLVDTSVTPNTCGNSVTTSAGSYVLNPATGVVTYTANQSATTGVQPAVTYRVTDSLGRTDTGVLTPNVPVMPVANPDSSRGEVDKPQTVAPTGNDAPGVASVPLVPSSVKICAVTTPTQSACTSTSAVVVAGKGTFTVDATSGAVTFTPEPGYVGSAEVAYTVTDTLGRSATSTITSRTLPKPAPTAYTDSKSGPYGQPIVFQPLSATNASAADSPGTPPPDAVSGNETTAVSNVQFGAMTLCALNEVPPNCAQTSVTTVDGTYVLSGTDVTFTPVAGFIGTVSQPLQYQIANSWTTTVTNSATNAVSSFPGTETASAYLIPTVQAPAPLVANPNTATTPWNTSVSANVPANDTSGAALDVTSVHLCGPNDVAPNCTQTSVTRANQGTYTVDPATGQVTFTPLASFAGAATPVVYSIEDALDRIASSTFTPTVSPPAPPTASPDTKSLVAGTSVAFASLLAGSGLVTSGATPVIDASTCLVDTSVTPNTCGNTITTSDGTYTLDPTTGIVTLSTGQNATSGVRPAVTYRVTDTFGTTVQSTLTPTIYARPTVPAKTGSDLVDQTQTFNILTGATKDPATTLTAATAALCNTNETAPNCTAGTVTITGKGVFTLDSNTGTVTFTPEPGFIGAVPGVYFVLTDGLGQKTSSTITATVVPLPTPTATDDTASGNAGTPLVFTPASNDNPGTVGIASVQNLALDLTSLRLCDIAPNAQTPPNCTATTVTTPDGTYTLDTNTNQVTFTETNGFTGTATTPVRYQISNTYTANGTPGSATTSALLTPTINAAQPPAQPPAIIIPLPVPPSEPNNPTPTPIPPTPVATDDTATGQAGQTLTFRPALNDIATTNGDITIEPTTIGLCGAGMTPPACTATTLTTPDGTYTIDTNTGNVQFVPAPGFTGQAKHPVQYQIWYQQGTGDTRRRLFAAAYLRPIITPRLPTTGTNTPWQTATIITILGCLITTTNERRIKKTR